jgi:hypothetical protein
MEKIDLSEYDLLPFDLEKCKAGHLTVTREGEVFEFGGISDDPRIVLGQRLIGWCGGKITSRNPDGLFYGSGGNLSPDLFLAVKKTVEKPKRTKGVNTYQISVRRGLEIIVNVEVDE